MRWFEPDQSHHLDRFQEVALGLMAAVTLLTFVGTNLQALLWQSSDWLIGTVLPAVVVDLTNEERTDLATAPLRRSAVLDAAATQKAQHMSDYSYFAHFAPDGTSPWYFFDTAGYVYAHAGENLAIHFTDSSEVVEAWMDSPAHRENIANGTFTEIGVGTARGTYDGYETVFVVQLFGTPAAVAATPLASVDVQPIAAEVVSEVTSIIDADSVALLPADLLVSSSGPQEVLSAVLEPEPEQSFAVEEQNIVANNERLVIKTQLATSSGLAVATIVETASFNNNSHAGATIAAVATQPNLVLDVVYSLLLSAVLVLLSVALFGEAKRLHYLQAAYSLLLIAGVGGLWFAHTLLTGGAVIL